MWDPYAEFETATLSNGLTIYAAHWPNRPWEAVGFFIYSGANQDSDGKEGTAHFVEHLISANAPMTEEEISSFFEEHGGYANLGATRFDGTRYKFFVPLNPEVIARAFDLFGRMLFDEKLENHIERERSVIVGEFNRTYALPYVHDLDRHTFRTVFFDHPRGRMASALGQPESISAITPGDLQAFYNHHYVPANMSIVAVGGLSLSEVTALVDKSVLAIDKPGKRNPAIDPQADPKPMPEKSHLFEISKHAKFEEAMKVGRYLAFARIPGTEKFQTIRALREMLNRLLLDEVRQKRAWAYHASSSLYEWGSFYSFEINCGGLAVHALGHIAGVVQECINSIRHREDLFFRVKKKLIARASIVDVTGNDLCNAAVDDLRTDRRIISFTEVVQELRSLEMSDIIRLLTYLEPERRWELLVRP